MCQCAGFGSISLTTYQAGCADNTINTGRYNEDYILTILPKVQLRWETHLYNTYEDEDGTQVRIVK